MIELRGDAVNDCTRYGCWFLVADCTFEPHNYISVMDIDPDLFNRAGDLLVERGFATRFLPASSRSEVNQTPSGVALLHGLHHRFGIPGRDPHTVPPAEITAVVGIPLFLKPPD